MCRLTKTIQKGKRKVICEKRLEKLSSALTFWITEGSFHVHCTIVTARLLNFRRVNHYVTWLNKGRQSGSSTYHNNFKWTNDIAELFHKHRKDLLTSHWNINRNRKPTSFPGFLCSKIKGAWERLTLKTTFKRKKRTLCFPGVAIFRNFWSFFFNNYRVFFFFILNLMFWQSLKTLFIRGQLKKLEMFFFTWSSNNGAESGGGGGGFQQTATCLKTSFRA